MSSFLFFLIFSSVFSSKTPGSPSFPYDLDKPNATFELAESMKEISGLSMSAEGNQIVAINDEEGIIYLMDKMTGLVTESISFWDEGDYEGIEVTGNDAWVVKSSGSLYHVKNYRSATDRQIVKYKSFLNKENDVEGLAYNPKRNSLLIGCKGKSVDGNDGHLKKAIYEFDLNKLMMMNEPVYLLTLPAIQEYLSQLGSDDHLEQMQELFSEEKNEMRFSPSGIAVHPLTGDIYVTSSKGKMLLVMDPQGKILHLVKMKKSIHPQPEGICFDADRTLYIANEGKEDKARIYKFLYRN